MILLLRMKKTTPVPYAPENIPYLRRSIRNLRYHQPVVKVMTIASGIRVEQPYITNKKKTISAIMDEIKNELDYKVGHYIKYEDISQSNKKNILRSFMFI